MAMQPTPYPHVNDLLKRLLTDMQAILDAKLVGLYLYGSLVTGDFDDASSDVDLLAVVSADLTLPEFDALDRMQLNAVQQQPHWEHRLEIAYLSVKGLTTFKTQISPIAIISPGEPFHTKPAGREWLINWYMVREKGRTLYGPPPQTLIVPVSREEFVAAVREHVRMWRDWMGDFRTRPAQAYAIITLCRALYTCTCGEQVSKKQAAGWAADHLPEWSSLIQNALLWRKHWRDNTVDHDATLPETQRFVTMMIERILADQTD
ncbi:MAG: DUF4111 domain-containing protein [Chloroflexi bacterium]|nr:DUF4111 domain-containing protein [Chloroflexota bacterium]